MITSLPRGRPSNLPEHISAVRTLYVRPNADSAGVVVRGRRRWGEEAMGRGRVAPSIGIRGALCDLPDQFRLVAGPAWYLYLPSGGGGWPLSLSPHERGN